MSDIQILRVSKISPKQRLAAAARHNLREIQRELGANSHINSSATHRNLILAGPPQSADVVHLAESLMREAGIQKPRKDAVWAVEYLFSLPAKTKISVVDYFQDCADWIANFTGCPVLSAVVHLDEACPHLHVLVLPLIGGRMNGAKLVGYKQDLATQKANHYREVGIRYGLRQAGTLSTAQKNEVAAAIFSQLSADPALFSLPDVKRALIALIKKSSSDLKQILGIPDPAPEPSRKTFVGLMTAPGKGNRFHDET